MTSQRTSAASGVAEHDPAAVRRREQQPPREAALEVAGDPEAGEDAAERGRLEQHEHELERRVAVREVEAGRVARSRDRPPANAVKKKSGKSERRDEERRVREDVVQRPPRDAAARPASVLTSAPSCSRSAQADERERDDRDRAGDAEAERERLAVPAGDDQAAHALEQVRDRVRGRDVAEPGDRRSGCAESPSTR